MDSKKIVEQKKDQVSIQKSAELELNKKQDLTKKTEKQPGAVGLSNMFNKAMVNSGVPEQLRFNYPDLKTELKDAKFDQGLVDEYVQFMTKAFFTFAGSRRMDVASEQPVKESDFKYKKVTEPETDPLETYRDMLFNRAVSNDFDETKAKQDAALKKGSAEKTTETVSEKKTAETVTEKKTAETVSEKKSEEKKTGEKAAYEMSRQVSEEIGKKISGNVVSNVSSVNIGPVSKTTGEREKVVAAFKKNTKKVRGPKSSHSVSFKRYEFDNENGHNIVNIRTENNINNENLDLNENIGENTLNINNEIILDNAVRIKNVSRITTGKNGSDSSSFSFKKLKNMAAGKLHITKSVKKKLRKDKDDLKKDDLRKDSKKKILKDNGTGEELKKKNTKEKLKKNSTKEKIRKDSIADDTDSLLDEEEGFLDDSMLENLDISDTKNRDKSDINNNEKADNGDAGQDYEKVRREKEYEKHVDIKLQSYNFYIKDLRVEDKDYIDFMRNGTYPISEEEFQKYNREEEKRKNEKLQGNRNVLTQIEQLAHDKYEYADSRFKAMEEFKKQIGKPVKDGAIDPEKAVKSFRRELMNYRANYIGDMARFRIFDAMNVLKVRSIKELRELTDESIQQKVDAHLKSIKLFGADYVKHEEKKTEESRHILQVYVKHWNEVIKPLAEQDGSGPYIEKENKNIDFDKINIKDELIAKGANLNNLEKNDDNILDFSFEEDSEQEDRDKNKDVQINEEHDRQMQNAMRILGLPKKQTSRLGIYEAYIKRIGQENADRDRIEQANKYITDELWNAVRQAAEDLGVSKEDAGNIIDDNVLRDLKNKKLKEKRGDADAMLRINNAYDFLKDDFAMRKAIEEKEKARQAKEKESVKKKKKAAKADLNRSFENIADNQLGDADEEGNARKTGKNGDDFILGDLIEKDKSKKDPADRIAELRDKEKKRQDKEQERINREKAEKEEKEEKERKEREIKEREKAEKEEKERKEKERLDKERADLEAKNAREAKEQKQKKAKDDFINSEIDRINAEPVNKSMFIRQQDIIIDQMIGNLHLDKNVTEQGVLEARAEHIKELLSKKKSVFLAEPKIDKAVSGDMVVYNMIWAHLHLRNSIAKLGLTEKTVDTISNEELRRLKTDDKNDAYETVLAYRLNEASVYLGLPVGAVHGPLDIYNAKTRTEKNAKSSGKNAETINSSSAFLLAEFNAAKDTALADLGIALAPEEKLTVNKLNEAKNRKLSENANNEKVISAYNLLTKYVSDREELEKKAGEIKKKNEAEQIDNLRKKMDEFKLDKEFDLSKLTNADILIINSKIEGNFREVAGDGELDLKKEKQDLAVLNDMLRAHAEKNGSRTENKLAEFDVKKQTSKRTDPFMVLNYIFMANGFNKFEPTKAELQKYAKNGYDRILAAKMSHYVDRNKYQLIFNQGHNSRSFALEELLSSEQMKKIIRDNNLEAVYTGADANLDLKCVSKYNESLTEGAPAYSLGNELSSCLKKVVNPADPVNGSILIKNDEKYNLKNNINLRSEMQTALINLKDDNKLKEDKLEERRNLFEGVIEDYDKLHARFTRFVKGGIDSGSPVGLNIGGHYRLITGYGYSKGYDPFVRYKDMNDKNFNEEKEMTLSQMVFKMYTEKPVVINFFYLRKNGVNA